MAWQLSGRMIEACSCNSACRCTLGPAEPDRGWCSGAFTFVIVDGQSNDVDLSGRTVVWMIDLPKDFVNGDGTAKLYVDDGANADQRRELEAIFTGQKGGPGEVLGGLVSKWLPSETVPIAVSGGEQPAVTIGRIGEATLQPIRNASGEATAVVNAPVLGLIDIERAELARADGSKFTAPDMRSWESGGHGSVSPFNWSG